MELNLSPDTLALNPGVGKTIQVERGQKEAKRANIPRAEPFERDGLSGLLLRGWSTECNGAGHRLYRWGGVSTGWCETQSDACAEAKRIERGWRDRDEANKIHG